MVETDCSKPAGNRRTLIKRPTGNTNPGTIHTNEENIKIVRKASLLNLTNYLFVVFF